MMEMIQAAWVIARRDYVATVWSKTFLLFLIGPLFPILFGFVFGAVGADIDRPATQPIVGVIAAAPEATLIHAAHERVTRRIGRAAMPDIRLIAPEGDEQAQADRLLADDKAGLVAIVTGGLREPRLAGPRGSVDGVAGPVALLLEEAQADGLLIHFGQARGELALPARYIDRAAGADTSGRILTARMAQLILVMLTMILAGMLLSNLIEEKSNKVIEVLAAAVPVDAIFLGKLAAMLAMSLTGICVWGTTAALGLALFAPAGLGAMPPPAVGWPLFAGLGVAYFTASYLLLGALFLGIGSQASTVREVQTLSMPVTMGQLVVFAFASSAVGAPDGGIALAASIFPWSSPFAMLARAAQTEPLWPHLIAIGWQALWVAIIVRVASLRFRRSVLKSGPAPGVFRRKAF